MLDLIFPIFPEYVETKQSGRFFKYFSEATFHPEGFQSNPAIDGYFPHTRPYFKIPLTKENNKIWPVYQTTVLRIQEQGVPFDFFPGYPPNLYFKNFKAQVSKLLIHPDNKQNGTDVLQFRATEGIDAIFFAIIDSSELKIDKGNLVSLRLTPEIRKIGRNGKLYSEEAY